MDVPWCLKVIKAFLMGSWRNSRRSGLKIRSQEIDVWVQLPPVPLFTIIQIHLNDFSLSDSFAKIPNP